MRRGAGRPKYREVTGAVAQIKSPDGRDLPGHNRCLCTLRQRDPHREEFDARAREGGGGIIGIPDTFINEHRDLIIELATWHHLPAVYGIRDFVSRGGLLAYSADFEAIFHRAAGYVDQTLRGVSPGELPVQAPDKFTLSVNLRAAGAIGLTLPQNLIARADEVIE
jgi:putative tryptophan/tyrosine transport system substrate-binding protein